MDAVQIRKLKPLLGQYLDEFEDCFARSDTSAHFHRYVEGQLSDLNRKSVEPMASKVGLPVRTLQEFLIQHCCDQDRMRDCLREIVVGDHSGPGSIDIIDETSFAKKGDNPPGVQRQNCGAVGKQDNCIVTVHLGFACREFHCLLDGVLFLPESWSNDRARCRDAGIPTARGEPDSRLRWTIRSTRVLARTLSKQGHAVSHGTAATMLGEAGFSLQATWWRR